MPSAPTNIGGIAYWRSRARRALRVADTPCFVFAPEPIAVSVEEVDAAFAGLPVRHWWSCKTLPLPAVLNWWRRQGRPVEVVSERELAAVLELGFPAGDILVNGPAKHRWLPSHPVPGLRVNLDSPLETAALLPLARRCRWQLGVRINTSGELNTEVPGARTQFGMTAGELADATRRIRRANLEVEVVHFHQRTNVPRAGDYGAAADEALAMAHALGWRPSVLDVGGGFPPRRVCNHEGAALDATFSLPAVRRVVRSILGRASGVREVWLENGRRLAAPGAALAVRVLDVKRGRGIRTLVCDGGRTLHALVATWERHALVPLRALPGRRVRTLVYGPTCMAFDNLGVHLLPAAIRPGDRLLWLDAGAYQLGWETRFSHGLAPVVWIEGDRAEVVRGGEAAASAGSLTQRTRSSHSRTHGCRVGPIRGHSPSP